MMVSFCRAEAIKGILSKKSSPSRPITHAMQNISLNSKGDATPGGSTADRRPQLTAKELEVLK